MVFLFGLILFPISEFSYLHQIFGKLYLVRTSDFDIFEVDPEADNDIPSDLKKPQILEELKKYTPFKIKSSLLYKFYMSKTFCCCFKSCKSQNIKQIEKLFEHGQDHLESDEGVTRMAEILGDALKDILTIDTLHRSLRVFGDMMPAVGVCHARMKAAALQGFSTATDLADYLVGKGIAFRDAHEVVGRAVRYGIDNDKDLSAMSLQELQTFSNVIDADVFTVLRLAGSMAARDHVGGTAPAQVRRAVSAARTRLQAD